MASSTPKGTPYVVGSDVAGQYPETSHTLANHIDNVNANQDNRITAVESGKVAKAGDSMSGNLTVPQITFGDDGFIQSAVNGFGMAVNNGSGSWQAVMNVDWGGAVFMPTLHQVTSVDEIGKDTHAILRLPSGELKHANNTFFSMWLNEQFPLVAELQARVDTLEARIAELEA